MLTIPEMQGWLDDHVTFLPDWTFEVSEDPYEGAVMHIRFSMPDSADPSRPFDADIETYISPNDRQSIETFRRWLDWRMQRIGSHEVREWLRENGQPISDPHAA